MSENPVVVAYRGPDSSGAVQLGSAIAATVRQPLVLVTAYRYEAAALSAAAVPGPGNERRFDAAHSRVERAHRLVPAGIEVREHVVPAEGIPDALAVHAHEVDASVLVVGRDFDGHVTRELLERAPCPLAVSPMSVPLPGEEPLRRIGVAYDASPAARYAVTAATHLAIATGGSVELITVASEGAGDETDAASVAARLADGVEASVTVLHGDPAAALSDVSERLDLLICGSRARGRILSAVLGSVSGRLIRAAHCPVLLVPPRVRHRATAPLGLTTAAG